MTSKLFSWLYNFGLLLILSCSLPKILYRCCTQKKYFETIKLKLWPKILQPPQTQGHRIWIHAVSLGETKAIIELTLQLKKIYPDSYLIISSGTDTGHAEAKKSIPIADEHIYLPFDFSFIIQKLVAKIEPTLVLVCETDFWHNFLSFSKAIGAKIALVNGKISAKSYQRFKSLPLLKDKIFQHFDLFCLQNETYLSRFKQLQIDVAKLKVTGNMKFDTPLKLISKNEFRHELKIDHSADIILIASTHELEEELLLTTLKPLLSDLIVLLVPRHPYRYEKVANQLKNLNFSVIKYSEKKAVTKGQILLLDQMGLLQGAFQISQLTIMGGSFIQSVGGHNILEPVFYGSPVIFGPYMHNQSEFVELVQKFSCGHQVYLHNIAKTLQSLIKVSKNDQNGQNLLKNLGGCTLKTVEFLQQL